LAIVAAEGGKISPHLSRSLSNNFMYHEKILHQKTPMKCIQYHNQ
jgi:hypothetical protein